MNVGAGKIQNRGASIERGADHGAELPFVPASD